MKQILIMKIQLLTMSQIKVNILTNRIPVLEMEVKRTRKVMILLGEHLAMMLVTIVMRKATQPRKIYWMLGMRYLQVTYLMLTSAACTPVHCVCVQHLLLPCVSVRGAVCADQVVRGAAGGAAASLASVGGEKGQRRARRRKVKVLCFKKATYSVRLTCLHRSL